VADSGLGVVALLLADDHNRLTAETGKTSLDGGVFGEFAVAGQRRELVEQGFGIVLEMRPVRMSCDLRFLPRIELAVDLGHGVAGSGFEPGDFIAGVDALVLVRKLPQLKDLAFQIGDRFFEIKIIVH
jgi:hypothetical protein